ncbi:MAG: ATP-binding protein, partial [bacterium]
AVYASYILPIIFFDNITNLGLLVNNNIFLLGTISICIVSNYFTSLLHFNEFKTRSDLEKATAELKELDTLKSQFMSNVSHELRTPLTNIIAPIESVIGQSKENLNLQQAEDIFKMVLINSKKLLKEINKLLDVSKIEAGKMKFKYALTNIPYILNIIVEPARELAKAKKIILSEKYTPDLEPIYVDSEYICQTFSNLLNNALKFTPENGKINIKTENDNEFIKVIFSDTGIGIDEKDIPHIFDRFRQADGSTSRKYEGTGIGLSLAKDIVALHKGTISVESIKEKGSTFTVRLPKGKTHLKKEEIIEDKKELTNGNVLEKTDLRYRANLQYTNLMSSTSKENVITDQTPLPDKKYKIVIVEDNKDLALNLNNILSCNYIITIANNGKEGLEKIRQEMPHLIISDVMMPEMDGYELCKVIKTTPETELIPLILLTAKSKIEDKIAGIQFGADCYINKPFDQRELLISVSSLIKQGELKKNLRDKNLELEETLKRLEKTMTELKETQVKLLHSAKLASVGQLAAGMAHEINTPVLSVAAAINAITKELDLLKDSKISIEEMGQDVKKVSQNSIKALDKIKTIVQALMDFSRKNKEGFNMSNIHQGIEDTLTLLDYQIKDKFTVHKEYGEIGIIECNLEELNQVFMNIINNACQAVEVKGNLWIKTKKANGNVTILIHNEGSSIPENIIPRVFEPFFTTKEVGKGSGLGLSICYGIVQNHNGTIEIKSDKNYGTEFIINLPTKQVKKEA